MLVEGEAWNFERSLARPNASIRNSFAAGIVLSIETSFDSPEKKKEKNARARASCVHSSDILLLFRAMFAHRAGYLSLVLGLLLPLILITNGDIEVGIPEYKVNPSNVSSSIFDHEMEPRSDDSSVVNRSVERKSGGPFSYRRDSYLEALRHSRTSTDPREGIVDAVATGSFHRRKEQSFGPVYTTKRSEITAPSSSRVVHADSFSMAASDSYSLPSRTSVDFNGVKNTYGPPSSYGPPSNDYSYGEYGGGYQPQQGEARGIYRLLRTEYIEYSSALLDFSFQLTGRRTVYPSLCNSPFPPSISRGRSRSS